MMRAAWGWDRVPGRLTLAAGPARSLVEATLIGLLAALLSAPPMIFDYRLVVLTLVPPALLALAWAALRLRTSSAPWPRRLARLAAMSLLFGVLVAGGGLVVGFLRYPLENALTTTPPSLFSPGAVGPLAGIETVTGVLLAGSPTLPADTPALLVGAARLAGYSLEAALVWAALRLLAAALSMPARALKRRAARRLVWRLTLSHFGVVVVSLLTAVVGILLLGTALSLGRVGTSAPPGGVAAQEAQIVAEAIAAEERAAGPLSTADLDAFLRYRSYAVLSDPGGLAGRLAALSGRARRLADSMRNPSLFGSDFIVLADLQGRITAASDDGRFPLGAPLASAPSISQQSAAWTGVWTRATEGEAALPSLTIARAEPQVLIGGAYPVIDRSGPVTLVTLVAARPEAALFGSLQFLIAGLTVGAVFLVGGLFLSVFSLLVALAFGYLVSRRLVRNLETVEAAAGLLASGQLDQRALVVADDEIGRLASGFNLMAERLQESQAQLAREKETVERTLALRRELIANVSHELRTPVSTIRAHVEWLLEAAAREDAPDADRMTDLRRYLPIIDAQTERLGKLIDELLDLSRLESAGMPIKREAVDVGEVIRSVQEMLASVALRERKIKLTSDTVADLPPVPADRERLEQVLVNLTRNAIYYTPAGGIVSLGAACCGPSQIAVWVADTGMGIPAEDLDRVFERFYRTDASRSRNTGGAGLGLAIVRALVEAMGGTITVESVVGEGSRFTVRLPLADAPAGMVQ